MTDVQKVALDDEFAPPHWQAIGALMVNQLRAGHTAFAIGMIPTIVETLVSLEAHEQRRWQQFSASVKEVHSHETTA